jgi:hypothetical protein
VLDGCLVCPGAFHKLCGVDKQHSGSGILERIVHLLAQARMAWQIGNGNTLVTDGHFGTAHGLRGNGAQYFAQAQAVEGASFAAATWSQK